ncbi:MAG: TRAP transporter TatT component family protein [Ignavibacteriales bacterium]|nr:TRAP transporter TatT component family protein [Ignavibacteriales bacterium]
MAGMLSGSSASADVFTSDNDPDFVGDALPFAIKLYETLARLAPRARRPAPPHRQPLRHVRQRLRRDARRHDARGGARDEGISPRPGQEPLPARPGHPVQVASKRRTPGIRATAQGAPIRRGHGPVRQGRRAAPLLDRRSAGWRPSPSIPWTWTLGQTVPQTRAMIERVAALEPGYGKGALDAFFVGYYGSLPGYHRRRPGQGPRAFRQGPGRRREVRHLALLSLATTVCVNEQNAAEFKRLLGEVLAFDPESSPPNRLVNILNQRKARWYLAHIDDFFIETEHP